MEITQFGGPKRLKLSVDSVYSVVRRRTADAGSVPRGTGLARDRYG